MAFVECSHGNLSLTGLRALRRSSPCLLIGQCLQELHASFMVCVYELYIRLHSRCTRDGFPSWL